MNAASQPTPEARRRPVLLVEDNSDLAELLADVLVDAGYEVTWTSECEEAVDAFRALAGDCLVLLDLHLPTAHGSEVLARLSAAVPAARPAVVLMTGGVEDATDHQELLRKPFDMRILLEVVRRHCG